MKKILIFLLTVIFILDLLSAQDSKENTQPTPADKPLAKYSQEFAVSLLRGVDDSMYPKIFKAKMSMETIRKGRTPIKFIYEIYSKDGTKTLMEIVYPARDKGKKILLLENNLWMYIPDVSRPIRLSRNQSFMGSTFSNEDVSDTTWEDDYEPVITDEKGEMLLLSLRAKRKEVAYKQIDIWINKETRVPAEGVYYGLSGKPIKKIYFSNVKEISGLLRPLDMRMVDLLEQGAYTDVKLLELKELESIPLYKFDASQLGR